MKKYVWAGALCLSQLIAVAGTPGEMPQQNISLSAEQEGSWKTEYIDPELRIESSVIVYEDAAAGTKHERVIFRYTNMTNKQMTVSFERTLTYDGVCYGCDKPEKRFVVELAPMETKQFSKENKDKTFYIFSKDIKNTIRKKLDKYNITKIEKQVK